MGISPAWTWRCWWRLRAPERRMEEVDQLLMKWDTNGFSPKTFQKILGKVSVLHRQGLPAPHARTQERQSRIDQTLQKMIKASESSLDAVDLLLKMGADPNALTNDGRDETMLGLASHWLSPAIASRLLAAGGDPFLANAHHQTAWSHALHMWYGSNENRVPLWKAVVDLLFEQGVRPHSPPSHGDNPADPVWWVAAEHWDADTLRRFQQQGADLTQRSPSGANAWRALLNRHLHCHRDDESLIACAQLLTKAGVPVEDVDGAGHGALAEAVSVGEMTLAQWLLASGVHPDAVHACPCCPPARKHDAVYGPGEESRTE